MAGSTPQAWWDTIRRARLFRVLAVYLGASFVVTELVDIFTDQLGLPDWFFPGAVALLLIGLPIILTTAFVQSALSRPTEAGAPDSSTPTPEAPPPTTTTDVAAVDKHWLTWRKAIFGAVLAFALLGVAVSAYMAMRTLGIGPIGSLVAKGVIEERERIILADFEHPTGDPLLGRAVTEAFRVDLAQSPLVTVVSPSYVAQVLDRMQQPPDAPLDRSLAREVAIREGITALIAGEITTAGTGFVLSAALLSADSGHVLAASRATAGDSTEFISAIDQLSEDLRDRIGEPLRSIRSSPPLQRMTTGSLEALRKYSQAVRAIEIEGDYPKGIALLQEAVDLDTAFAMAYRKLGVALFNVGEERARMVRALTRAFDHRDRLPDRERYMTVGSYHQFATNEQTEAITAYRTLLDIYPDHSYALTNLSFAYFNVRDYKRAAQLGRHSIEVEPGNAINNIVALWAQVSAGQNEEVEATLGRMSERVPNHPGTSLAHSYVASMRGDYDLAEDHVRALAEAQKADQRWLTRATLELATLAGVRGKLSAAERYLRDATAVNEERDLAAGYLQKVIDLALLGVGFRGEATEGLALIEEALERYPLDSIAPLDRPYLPLALLYALSRRPDRARELVAEYDEMVEGKYQGLDAADRHLALGLLAVAEDRLEEAIAEFQRADQGACPICALHHLGTAYELAGEPDSAVAAYERYLETPWIGRTGSWPAGLIHSDMYWLGPTFERLGALHEEGGETEKAIYYYGKLVHLWEHADPELQPRVEAARRAIEALSTDR
jgi:tetratricopeptide (TPR) repeat protein